MAEETNLTILIAPLDWGLGHATRCVPLIRHLLGLRCKVIIATEGIQEKLLKTEFPALEFIHLPGYRIRYTTNKRFFPFKIILQVPKILLSVKKENNWLKNFLKSRQVDAIISDNRYGFYNTAVPSVFITHQLLIKAPFDFAEKIMQRINFRLIQRFTTCWVPDFEGQINLAGVLSHPVFFPKTPVSYIGGLSRLKLTLDTTKKYDLLVMISGPEPQRTLLENKMLQQVQQFAGKVLLVRGLPGNAVLPESGDRVSIVNHLPANQLSDALQASEFVISRSGYTTVMDICKLKKKSILIPTPGQTEQEYLAKHLHKQGWCLAATQEDFSLLEMVQRAKDFDFRIPELDMDQYKVTLDAFVSNLAAGNALRKDLPYK